MPNEPILEWSAGVLTGMASFDSFGSQTLTGKTAQFLPHFCLMKRVENQNWSKTGPVQGGGTEGLKMRFSSMCTGLSRGSEGVVPNGTERYSFSGFGRGASPSSNGAPVSSPAGPFDVDVPRFPTLNPQPIRRPSSFDGLRHGLRWQAQRDTAFTRHKFQCAPSPIRTACWPSTLDFRHSSFGPSPPSPPSRDTLLREIPGAPAGGPVTKGDKR